MRASGVFAGGLGVDGAAGVLENAAMNLGVRAHDFGKLPIDELATRIAAAGFNCVQFTPPKAIAGFDADAGRLSPGLAVHVRETLRRHGISIAVLGCYINLGDPDEARRRPHLERFKEYLRHARDFGCSVVGTETGSVNPDFSFHPENESEAAFQNVLGAVRELVREAEKFGVFVGIEAVKHYVVSSPKKLRRLLDEVGSNHLQIIFDPVNLVDASNHAAQRALMEESFALFGDRIAILHAKDFAIIDGKYRQVAAGEGVLDYDLFFRLAKQHKPWIQTVLEDTNPATVAKSVAFVRAVDERVR